MSQGDIEVVVDGLGAAIDLEDIIRWAVNNQPKLVSGVIAEEKLRRYFVDELQSSLMMEAHGR